MKKKFLTGMLLGTLALSATPFVVGCSDDDDISRLEEQVAANTNAATVDKNELLALINKTSAELTEQLELAVSGKADNQAVIELQKKVAALTEQLNSASGTATEQITSLISQINALVEQVDAVKGDLSVQKTELENQIAQLKQEIENANSEEIETLTQELTSLQNDLLAVKRMAENNGASIASLTQKITELENLSAKVSALESSSQTYAADIAAINATLSTLATSQELSTLDTELSGEIAAINQKLSSYVESSDYNALASRVNALEQYKNETLVAALNGKADAADMSNALARISSLELQIGQADITEIDNEIEQLKKDFKNIIGMANAQVQSFMYIPSNAERTVEFNYLFLKDGSKELKIAEPLPTQLAFRVSPASAAASFADNYAFSFEKYVQRADDDVFAIELAGADAKSGIVTFDVIVANPDDLSSSNTSWSSCIYLHSKNLSVDSSAVNTQITSDFFTMSAKREVLANIYANSRNNIASQELIIEDGTTISYDTVLTDVNAVWSNSNRDLLASYNIKDYSVSYALTGSGKDYFKFENGVLSPKDTKNIDGDGAMANIKSTLKVAGKSYDMTYAAVTLKAKTEFVGTFETEKFDYASEYSKSMSASAIAKEVNMTVENFMGNFEFTSSSQINEEDVFTYSEGHLTLKIPAKTPIAKNEQKVEAVFTGKDGNYRGKTVTLTATLQQVVPSYEISIKPDAPTILVNVTSPDKTTIMGIEDITLDVEEYFMKTTNTNALDALYGEGNYTFEINVSLEDGCEGVSQEGAVITVDQATYNGKNITVTSTVMVAGEKKDEVKKTFDVQRIITKWDGGTSKSFTLTKGTKLNLGEGFALSTTIGATLNNYKPIVLWKNGADVVWDTENGSLFNNDVDVMTLYGLTSPTCTIKTENVDSYINVDGFVIEMKEVETAPASDIVIEAVINVESFWGEVEGMPANGEIPVTITIPQSEWAK